MGRPAQGPGWSGRGRGQPPRFSSGFSSSFSSSYSSGPVGAGTSKGKGTSSANSIPVSDSRGLQGFLETTSGTTLNATNPSILRPTAKSSDGHTAAIPAAKSSDGRTAAIPTAKSWDGHIAAIPTAKASDGHAVAILKAKSSPAVIPTAKSSDGHTAAIPKRSPLIPAKTEVSKDCVANNSGSVVAAIPKRSPLVPAKTEVSKDSVANNDGSGVAAIPKRSPLVPAKTEVSKDRAAYNDGPEKPADESAFAVSNLPSDAAISDDQNTDGANEGDFENFTKFLTSTMQAVRRTVAQHRTREGASMELRQLPATFEKQWGTAFEKSRLGLQGIGDLAALLRIFPDAFDVNVASQTVSTREGVHKLLPAKEDVVRMLWHRSMDLQPKKLFDCVEAYRACERQRRETAAAESRARFAAVTRAAEAAKAAEAAAVEKAAKAAADAEAAEAAEAAKAAEAKAAAISKAHPPWRSSAAAPPPSTANGAKACGQRLSVPNQPVAATSRPVPSSAIGQGDSTAPAKRPREVAEENSEWPQPPQKFVAVSSEADQSEAVSSDAKSGDFVPIGGKGGKSGKPGKGSVKGSIENVSKGRSSDQTLGKGSINCSVPAASVGKGKEKGGIRAPDAHSTPEAKGQTTSKFKVCKEEVDTDWPQIPALLGSSPQTQLPKAADATATLAPAATPQVNNAAPQISPSVRPGEVKDTHATDVPVAIGEENDLQKQTLLLQQEMSQLGTQLQQVQQTDGSQSNLHQQELQQRLQQLFQIAGIIQEKQAELQKQGSLPQPTKVQETHAPPPPPTPANVQTPTEQKADTVPPRVDDAAVTATHLHVQRIEQQLLILTQQQELVIQQLHIPGNTQVVLLQQQLGVLHRQRQELQQQLQPLQQQLQAQIPQATPLDPQQQLQQLQQHQLLEQQRLEQQRLEQQRQEQQRQEQQRQEQHRQEQFQQMRQRLQQQQEQLQEQLQSTQKQVQVVQEQYQHVLQQTQQLQQQLHLASQQPGVPVQALQQQLLMLQNQGHMLQQQQQQLFQQQSQIQDRILQVQKDEQQCAVAATVPSLQLLPPAEIGVAAAPATAGVTAEACATPATGNGVGVPPPPPPQQQPQPQPQMQQPVSPESMSSHVPSPDDHRASASDRVSQAQKELVASALAAKQKLSQQQEAQMQELLNQHREQQEQLTEQQQLQNVPHYLRAQQRQQLEQQQVTQQRQFAAQLSQQQVEQQRLLRQQLESAGLPDQIDALLLDNEVEAAIIGNQEAVTAPYASAPPGCGVFVGLAAPVSA